MATMKEAKAKAAERRAEIYRRVQSGESQASIAHEMGVTRPRVSQMVKVHKAFLVESDPIG